MNQPSKARQDALIVLGMHRSGTSALAGVMSLLGADPGPSLMPATESVNPKGFWEHADIVAVHDRLLAALGSSWNDERPLPDEWWRLPAIAEYRDELLAILQRDFENSPLWILKDPRQCRLMPMWLQILHDFGSSPLFVICLRHPGEVAASLERRDGIHTAKSCLLWLEHLVESERWTRGFPRVLMTYENLLRDWQATIDRIVAELSLTLPISADAVTRVSTFLEPSLRHHHGDYSFASGRLPKLASEAYRLAVEYPLDQIGARLAPVAAETLEIALLIAPWSDHVHHLRSVNARLLDSNRLLQADVARIKSTVSWRITAPLRVAWNAVRRLGRARQ